MGPKQQAHIENIFSQMVPLTLLAFFLALLSIYSGDMSQMVMLRPDGMDWLSVAICYVGVTLHNVFAKKSSTICMEY